MRSPAAAWLLRVYPVNGAGAEVELRFSTDRLISLAGDTIGVKAFRALMTSPPAWRGDVWRDGRLGGRVDVGAGVVRLANPLPDEGPGPLEELRALHFDGRRWEAYWAEGHPAPPLSFDAYERVLAGVVERRRMRGDEVELVLRDGRYELDQFLRVPTFRGTGAYALRASATTTAICGDVLDQAGSFSIEVLVKPRNTGVLNQKLCWKRDAFGGYGLEFSQSAGQEGRFRFRVPGCTPENLAYTGAALPAQATEFYRISACLDNGAKTRALYVDGVLAGSDTFTGAPAVNAATLSLVRDADCDLQEVRIWSRALTADEVAEMTRHRVEPAAVAGLAGRWLFNEGFGTSAVDDVAARNAALTNASWVTSFEGGLDLEGRHKPIALGGRVYSVPPVEVNPAARALVWHYRGSQALHVARGRGAVLAEGSAPTGNYTKDLATSSLTVHTMPGQEGRFTADVTGDDGGGGPVPSNFPSMFRHLATVLGPLSDGDLDAAVFGVGGASTFPNLEPLALWVEAGGKLSDVLSGLAEGVGAAYWVDPQTGLLTAARLEAPAVDDPPDLTLSWRSDFSTLDTLDELLPTLSQSVGYQRAYATAGRSDLVASDAALGVGGSATDGAAYRAFVALETRQARFETTRPVAARHPQAEDGVPVEAHFTTRRAAWAEARRRQRGIWGREGVTRIRLTLARKVDGLRFGAAVRVVDPRNGYPAPAGRLMLLTGIDWTVEPYGAVELFG